MLYRIVPVQPVAAEIYAESPESALEGFAWAMDSDMGAYFKAVPVEGQTAKATIAIENDI